MALKLTYPDAGMAQAAARDVTRSEAHARHIPLNMSSAKGFMSRRPAYTKPHTCGPLEGTTRGGERRGRREHRQEQRSVPGGASTLNARRFGEDNANSRFQLQVWLRRAPVGRDDDSLSYHHEEPDEELIGLMCAGVSNCATRVDAGGKGNDGRTNDFDFELTAAQAAAASTVLHVAKQDRVPSRSPRWLWVRR
jgi:hypothetical protein